MKILFLSDDFPPYSFGGAGISTYELAKGVQKVGHKVFIITTVRKNSEARESNFGGLKIFKIASDYPERWRAYRGLYNPPVIRELKKILKEINPDVVHVNNVHYYLSYHSIKVAKQYARAVVFTARDAMSFSFGKLETEKYFKSFDAHMTWLDQLKQAKKRWNPLRNFLVRRYLQYADKKFAVSNALKKALEQNGIKGAEVMHTGIDISDYIVLNKELSKRTVFFGGRLSEAKGSKVVEKVMEIVSKEFPDAAFSTAGTGDSWLNREEMKLAYATSDIVLVPSICFDAFPRMALEAMAVGRPVIGTCYGGASEAIIDGQTGYIVNPFDIEVVAGKIIDLLKNPDKARRFGQAGRKRIQADFNLSDKIAVLVSTYERLT